MDIAYEADFQRDPLVENVLGQVAQFHGLAIRYGDILDQPGSVADAMSPAILDGLPDRFFSKALTGVNGDVEILALNVMESVDMLFGWIAALFSSEVEPDDSALAKIDGQFRHLKRYVHVAHSADDQSGRYAEVLPAALQSLQHGRHDLLVSQIFPGMKNRRKASLKVNHAILAQILGLFICHALKCIFRLHHPDGVGKPSRDIWPGCPYSRLGETILPGDRVTGREA